MTTSLHWRTLFPIEILGTTGHGILVKPSSIFLCIQGGEPETSRSWKKEENKRATPLI